LIKKPKKTYNAMRSHFFSILYKKIYLNGIFKPKFKILKKYQINKFNYKVYSIRNCRIYTNCVENVSIIKNNQLISEGSMQQISGKLVNAKKNEVLKTGTPKFLKEIKGNVFNLTQGASGYDNYAHWLFDIVPKIKILSETYDLKKIDYFYFSKLNSFQKETFKIFKLNPNKIIDSKIYKHCLFEKLIFCTHPNYFKGTFSTAQNDLPKWIVNFLRKKLLKNSAKKIKSFKKIYIDRSDSQYNHCKIINDDEIKNHLRKRGFKIIKLSKFNLRKQISIFKNCNLVIGPHGAGMANLIFCKRNTKVIEIQHFGHPNKVYQRISKFNKLKHHFIMLKKIKNEKKGDMFLEVRRLKNYLN
tara:strand:- start:95 stop:1165 length:1071 start_codon:yes stop_codon:yes gene_type:complete